MGEHEAAGGVSTRTGPTIHEQRLKRGAISLREALGHSGNADNQALHAISRFGVWARHLADALESGEVDAQGAASQLRDFALLGGQAFDAWNLPASPTVAFPHPEVTERDLDFLLSEELCCNPEFADWLMDRSSVPLPRHLLEVHRSVTSPLGETDLLVICSSAGCRHAIMIENKIAAAFQHNQPERYRRRGQEGVISGEWGAFCTVLMAPRDYLEAVESDWFDYQVSYEDAIIALDNGRASPRQQFRQEVIHTAIKKTKTPWERVVDPELTAFFRMLRRVVEVEFPDVPFPLDRNGRAPGHTWVMANLGACGDVRVNLEIKVFNGHVDLRFTGLGESGLRRLIAHRLPPRAVIVGAAKSSAVRFEVTPIDRDLAPQEQIEVIRSIFSHAEILVSFLGTVRPLISEAL